MSNLSFKIALILGVLLGVLLGGGVFAWSTVLDQQLVKLGKYAPASSWLIVDLGKFLGLPIMIICILLYIVIIANESKTEK